jgi:hypothetical protein
MFTDVSPMRRQLQATDPSRKPACSVPLLSAYTYQEASSLALAIAPAQLGYMLEGIAWRHPQRTWRPVIAR